MTWGKFAASVIICLHCSYAILAQGKFDPVIHQLGPFCEGKIFEIGMLDEFSCFHITFGSRYCASPVPYRAEDRSENIQVAGGNPISRRVWRTYTNDGINYIKVWLYTFKAEKSAEITITCNSPVDVDIPEGCTTTEKSYIQQRTYIYQFEVVPKPPTPSLSVERYISPGSVNFIATGCPTNKEGYDYRWNEVICRDNPNENFYFGSKDGKRIGAGGANYRVLCSALNGACISDPSDFERGISYTPPSDDCIPDEFANQIARIEDIKRPSDPGPISLYHNFPVETQICDKSVDPNCTVENVFNTMISENQFITPIPSDLPGIDFFDVDKNYSPKNKSVVSCGVVNLPALLIESLIKANEGVFTLSNPVMTYIDRSNYIAMNYTLSDHIFSPGRVVRKVIQMCDKIYVITIGEGLSDIGADVAWINANFGDNIFRSVDDRLKSKYGEKFQR
ncbi:hypothetical protein [Spirosoma endophyticum]|uniref:Uncharacterized protein n=1 Tax=Spirosoma endophyticum TaxID=662367 RepID=A0A1I2FV12_9BACT|nr:hypothetical protein [Spirosoma endophyticum]SFF09274.1 hypothetical protein SAMN05216167_12815 [Spirosoma endophyticum]